VVAFWLREIVSREIPIMSPSEYEALVNTVAYKMTNISVLRTLGNPKSGQSNKWKGASGFCHQIDVSLENDQHVLLIECKQWKENVKPEAFLVLMARVIDISTGPEAGGRRIRGALVTCSGVTSGVNKLVEYYHEKVSLFEVSSDGEFKIIRHTYSVTPEPAQ
jgi:hypothetical protein